MAENDHPSEYGIERSTPDDDAVFLRWQETPQGEMFPIYTITKPGHPSFHSTVSDTTLRSFHLRIPSTPSPYTETKAPAWHNLGTPLNRPSTARKAVEAAGLDFTVVKKPMDTIEKMWPRRYDWAMVRRDTGAFLGVVGDSYEPVQNRDAFEFFDTLVGGGGAVYETAGVIGRGERMWMLAKLPGFIRVRGKDLVNKYILLMNNHGGGSPVRAKLTPLRLVCNNALTATWQGTAEVRIHHTRNTAENLTQAHRLLALSEFAYKQLENTFNRLAQRMMTEKELLEYVTALVPDNEEREDDARTKEIRNQVLALHESGQGSSLARGTLWGAYNSVAEYTDHLMLDENPSKRLESIWFGRGEELKLKAFRLAESMM